MGHTVHITFMCMLILWSNCRSRVGEEGVLERISIVLYGGRCFLAWDGKANAIDNEEAGFH